MHFVAHAQGLSHARSSQHFSLENSQLSSALESDTPARIPHLALLPNTDSQTTLESVLAAQGLHALLVVPIHSRHPGGGLLVLASHRPNAYLIRHQALLTNLSPFIGHALEKHVN